MEREPSSVRIDEEAAVGVNWADYSLTCYRAATPQGVFCNSGRLEALPKVALPSYH